MNAPDSHAEASSPRGVTRLLVQMSGGNRAALDALLPIIYDELHQLAQAQLRGRGRPGETLNTTGLVHEAYFRLVDHHAVDWQDRTHFFAVAARAMRQVIVTYARKRSAQKRGGGVPNLSLDDVAVGDEQPAAHVIALDEALARLAELDARQAQVVECRFFAGFTVEETAQALSISESTVKRDWKTAKLWLYREMQP